MFLMEMNRYGTQRFLKKEKPTSRGNGFRQIIFHIYIQNVALTPEEILENPFYHQTSPFNWVSSLSI